MAAVLAAILGNVKGPQHRHNLEYFPHHRLSTRRETYLPEGKPKFCNATKSQGGQSTPFPCNTVGVLKLQP